MLQLFSPTFASAIERVRVREKRVMMRTAETAFIHAVSRNLGRRCAGLGVFCCCCCFGAFRQKHLLIFHVTCPTESSLRPHLQANKHQDFRHIVCTAYVLLLLSRNLSSLVNHKWRRSNSCNMTIFTLSCRGEEQRSSCLTV